MNYFNSAVLKTICSSVYIGQNHNENRKRLINNKIEMNIRNLREIADINYIASHSESKKFLSKLLQILRVISN